jgi:hypothetical protein
MKRVRNQYSLGSLMILVATVALLLSVPMENWVVLWLWIPNITAMLMLVFVGFGVAFIGSKLASGIGLSIDRSPLESRRHPLDRPIDPSAGREM